MEEKCKALEPDNHFGYRYTSIAGRPHRVSLNGEIWRYECRGRRSADNLGWMPDPTEWEDIEEDRWKLVKLQKSTTSREPILFVSKIAPFVGQRRHRAIDVVAQAFFEGYSLDCKSDFKVVRNGSLGEFSREVSGIEVYRKHFEGPFNYANNPFLVKNRNDPFFCQHRETGEWFFRLPGSYTTHPTSGKKTPKQAKMAFITALACEEIPLPEHGVRFTPSDRLYYDAINEEIRRKFRDPGLLPG